jgi:uncharacterized protein (TIGR04255 family)
MVKIIKNSPIVEAVCELRFKDATDDLTIFGKLHDKLKGIYPNKKRSMLREIKFASTEGKTTAIPIETDLQQFINNEGTSLIQIGKNILTINELTPYSSWVNFYERITQVYNTYSEITGLNQVERIGLRYINKIEFVDEFIKLGDYFKLRPTYDTATLGEEHGQFIVGVRFYRNNDQDNLKIELRTCDPKPGFQYAFILDIDYFTLTATDITSKNALSWISTAHGEAEKAFFSCITENLIGKLNQ